MAYSIAVASGKGGTGKTTVAVSLFQLLFRELDGSVQLIDCDVEEPNDGLFFPEKQQAGHAVISKKLPVIDKEKCTYCRRCADYCEFNAIVVLPTAHFAEISADLCHSCGACLVACNDNAISEIPEPIGEVTRFTTGNGAMLVEGKLKIGSSMQTMLIRELKAGVSAATAVNIYDAPPGTSCPVVETIADADFVVLVTESLVTITFAFSLLRSLVPAWVPDMPKAIINTAINTICFMMLHFLLFQNKIY